MTRNPSLLSSFANALRGLTELARTERNFRIHLVATCVVIFFGFMFSITRFEWLILIIIITAVLALEIMNAVVERVMDVVKPRLHPILRDVKDMMAGAVLLAALASVVTGSTIFAPYIASVLKEYGIL